MPASTRSCPSCTTVLPLEAQFCFHCGRATPADPDAPPRTQATGEVEVAKVRKALAIDTLPNSTPGYVQLLAARGHDFVALPGLLRLDPTNVSLRGHPRFEQLIAR